VLTSHIQLFPRGNQKPAVDYDSPTRTASAFFYWASRLVPNNVKKLHEPEDITNWASKVRCSLLYISKADNLTCFGIQKITKPRALLLNKDKKVPLLWQVLSNKYGQDIQFGSHRDRKGKTSLSLGFKAGEKKASKVVIYPADSTVPVLYEGRK
jgi:protein disulfide-isomerase A6